MTDRLVEPEGSQSTLRSANKKATTRVAFVLAVEAVLREPVSSPKSLLTGKNTGNFTRFGGANSAPFHRNPHPDAALQPPTPSYGRFLTGNLISLFRDLSGNLFARTGNFSSIQSTAKSTGNIALYGSTAAPYSRS
jgi:hypothetical protein